MGTKKPKEKKTNPTSQRKRKPNLTPLLKKIGKWYKKEETINKRSYINYFYITGIIERFNHIGLYGHRIEIEKTEGDSHMLSTIHVNNGLNEDYLKDTIEITNKEEIDMIDKMLGTLFYKL